MTTTEQSKAVIEIKHRCTGEVIHTVEGETLRGANLWDANLRDANLTGADLRGADLSGAFHAISSFRSGIGLSEGLAGDGG